MTWTLAFTLTWPKTSSVHFLFLQGIKFQKLPIFHHIYAQNSYSTSHIWTKQDLGIKPDPCPTSPRSLVAWHIPKYEDNRAETFSPNIKCQTPHMLKFLYSPKQNVKYYLTSLHINEVNIDLHINMTQNILSPLPVSAFDPRLIFPLWYTILTNTTKSAHNHAAN